MFKRATHIKRVLLVSCALAGMNFSANAAFAMDEFSAQDASSSLVQAAASAHQGQSSVTAGAEHFVDALAREGIGFLGNAAMSQSDRQAAFKKLLNKHFDMKTIARFALGRYWRTATEAQRAEYIALFQKMTVNVYSDRFNDYKGQVLEVRGSRAEQNPSDTLVNSFIIQPDGPEVQVDWRIRYKNGQYKVVDVLVGGVSMAMTQRSDFASVIQRGGGDIETLLIHLRQ